MARAAGVLILLLMLAPVLPGSTQLKVQVVAVLCLVAYLCTPPFIGHWIWQQRRHSKPTGLGFAYLAGWLIPLPAILVIATGGVYMEGSHTEVDALAIVSACVLVILPPSAFFHLGSKGRRSSGV